MADVKVLESLNDRENVSIGELMTGGICNVELSSWKDFMGLVLDECDLFVGNYGYRGQTKDQPLKPSLYRGPFGSGMKAFETILEPEIQVNNFINSSKGLAELTDGDSKDLWWSLGQHHQLKTPLLDWTLNPAVALFFAFVGEKTDSSHRCVYWLDYRGIKTFIQNNLDKVVGSKFFDNVMKKSKIKSNQENKVFKVSLSDEGMHFKFIDPYDHNNKKIIAQSGRLALLPFVYPSIESYLNEVVEQTAELYLLKIKISSESDDRDECLRFLNHMNVNYKTLFPDIYGSANHCNLALSIKGYYGI